MKSQTFRTAFVTGASSGLGRGIALKLAGRGTHVVACARRRDALLELRDQAHAVGGRIEAVELDVCDTSALQSTMQEWARHLNGFDLVLANAGIAPPKTQHPLSWEGIEPVLLTNIQAAFATLSYGLQEMRTRGNGTLAGMSSLAGLRGFPESGAYSASKAALSTFLESMQSDLADTSIRVVDIQPGFVRTPMTALNKFHMPFLMELEPAVERCVRGLERGKSIVHFPGALSWPLRLGFYPLPRAVWLRIARLMRKRAADSNGETGFQGHGKTAVAPTE